ncbi:hypothetical protein D3C85_1531010 [compost metagenome]
MLDAGGVPGAALAEHGQARAAVFAALVVMGCRGQQVVRETAQALLAGPMEILGRSTETLRVEAYIVA